MGEELVYNNGYCGLEINFHEDMDRVIAYHVNSPFHFVFTPLVDPAYKPSLMEKGTNVSDLSPFAGHWYLNNREWSNHLVGKISSWIDLDSDDELLRKDSEITLREEVQLASKLSLQVCLLPAPRSSSCVNYARCVNQILQNLSNMQLLLRIPLEESDDNDNKGEKLKHTGECPADSFYLWKSFRHLCEHNRLSVAFDFQSSLPSVNSLGCWSDESLGATIIDSRIFQGLYLNVDVENRNKVIAWLLNNSIKIVVSCFEIQAPIATNYNNQNEASLLYAMCQYKFSQCREDDEEDEDYIFGTTLFAMKYENGVVLGADSRMSGQHDGRRQDTALKQFLIGGNIYLAFSGSRNIGLKIVDELREKFNLINETGSIYISGSLVADWAFDKLKNLKGKDVVHLIIVGEAEIYKVLPDGKSNVDMAIIGSPAAGTVAISKNIPSQTREEAKQTVFEGIKRAKIVSYTTGGAIKLLFIDNFGCIQTELAEPQDHKSSVTRYDWVMNDFVPDGCDGCVL